MHQPEFLFPRPDAGERTQVKKVLGTSAFSALVVTNSSLLLNSRKILSFCLLLVYIPALVSTGIEFIFILVPGTVLCFKLV